MGSDVRCSAGLDSVGKLLAASQAKTTKTTKTTKTKTAEFFPIPHDSRLVLGRTGSYTLACPVTTTLPTPATAASTTTTAAATTTRVCAVDPGIRSPVTLYDPSGGGKIFEAGNGAAETLLHYAHSAFHLQSKKDKNKNKNKTKGTTVKEEAPAPAQQEPPQDDVRQIVSFLFLFFFFFLSFFFFFFFFLQCHS